MKQKRQNVVETTFLVLATILSQAGHVAGHGRLIQPPQRSSAWRFDFNNPINYRDNKLDCGGYEDQWLHDGKCGACGDPYDALKKPNEDVDGLYVKNDVITAHYDKGDSMKVQVEITTNHRGWFEFRLCPLETPDTRVTQECLNRTLLHEVGGSRTRFYLNSTDIKIFEFTLQLPTSVSCERCVLQWKYNTGDSWDCDAAACGMGHGKQETFVNCADIEIRDNGVTPPSSRQSATLSALTSSASRQSSSRMTGKVCSQTLICKPTDAYIVIPGMFNWCCQKCQDFPESCPSSHCVCERY